MKIAVTGATGFIGVPLVRALREAGHEVTAFVRDRERAAAKLADVELVEADLETPGAWCDVLGRVDAVAHLAGEPIANKRWDARQKQLIRDSRTESTRTIVESIGKLAQPVRPRALVCASGADFYPYALGVNGFDDDEVTETDKPGETFLGRVCRDWEAEAVAAEAYGVRVACMRTGLVLGAGGGALAQLRRPFELFVGGRMGSGRQFVTWIHLDDAVAAYVAALTDKRFRGPINLVAASVRFAAFSRALGSALHRPSWLPLPGFMLKVVAGTEMAEAILGGRNVVPAKLRALGFSWRYPDLEAALRASV
jgi:uncharacterized protein (TIGR01777 family)